MRRRLDIAASILVTPELLFLDEPTTGLDPRSRSQVWGLIRGLVASGTTVLLTTQYLEEADQLAERIAVIDGGKVIAEGTPSELKASVGASVLHVRLDRAEDRAGAQQVLAAQLIEGVVVLDADPRALTVRIDDTARAAATLGALSAAGVRVASFSLGQPSLDEVFFALTGHGASEAPTDGAPEVST